MNKNQSITPSRGATTTHTCSPTGNLAKQLCTAWGTRLAATCSEQLMLPKPPPTAKDTKVICVHTYVQQPAEHLQQQIKGTRFVWVQQAPQVGTSLTRWLGRPAVHDHHYGHCATTTTSISTTTATTSLQALIEPAAAAERQNLPLAMAREQTSTPHHHHQQLLS